MPEESEHIIETTEQVQWRLTLDELWGRVKWKIVEADGNEMASGEWTAEKTREKATEFEEATWIDEMSPDDREQIAETLRGLADKVDPQLQYD